MSLAKQNTSALETRHVSPELLRIMRIMTPTCFILFLVAFMAAGSEGFAEEAPSVEYDDGILSDCSNTISEFGAVIASGKHLLVRDPKLRNCLNFMCERKHRLEWVPVKCRGSTENGWLWFHDFQPGEFNRYRIYLKFNNEMLIEESRYFLPEKAPPVQRVEATVGQGYVRLLIWPPGGASRLLGYRISLLDLEKQPLSHSDASVARSSAWRVVGEFDAVVYRCARPHLFPVHPCPEWRRPDRPFCALFSDSVDWTTALRDGRTITADTMKYVKVESFQIPFLKHVRIYSSGLVLPLYDLNATKLENATIAKGETPGRSTVGPPHQWTDSLSLVFLSLTIAVFVVVLPLVHYLATKAGREEAKVIRRKEQSANLRTGAAFTDRLKTPCGPFRRLKRAATGVKEDYTRAPTPRWRGRLIAP